jgi:cysteine-rich repeat protein
MKNKINLLILVVLLISVGTAFGAVCTDTDGGKNYNVKGTAKSSCSSQTYTDTCNGNYLKEYYCSGGYVTHVSNYCSYKCQNGACVPKPVYVCGNGILEGSEACDAGSNNGVPCTASYGSTCTYCSSACNKITVTGPKCGDGITQSPQEQCDDGNTKNGDGCSSICKTQCLENWQCSAWGSCSAYPNSYKSRTCTDLNACGTTYNKPTTSQQCSCYNTWQNEVHMLNVGDVVDEIGHNLSDWGPVEPATHGGSWGSSPTGSSCCAYGSNLYPKAYDGTARVVSDITSTDNASLLMPFGYGSFYNSQYLQLMALKGISLNDSFDVYIGGNKVFSFVDDGTRNIEESGSFKFDMGTETSPVKAGYTKVTENTLYYQYMSIPQMTAQNGWPTSPSYGGLNGFDFDWNGNIVMLIGRNSCDPVYNPIGDYWDYKYGCFRIYDTAGNKLKQINITELESYHANDAGGVDIDTINKRIYILPKGYNNLVMVFDENYVNIQNITLTGTPVWYYADLCTKGGSMYVTGKEFIYKFDMSGNLQASYPAPTQNWYNSGPAGNSGIDCDGSNFDVLDRWGLVHFYDNSFTDTGTQPLNMNIDYFFGIAIDGTNLWANDLDHAMMIQYDLSPTLVRNTTFGWDSVPAGSRDRALGDDLQRDLIFDSAEKTFIVDVPNDGAGYYLTVYLGDMQYAHDNMQVFVEGNLIFDGISTVAGEIKKLTKYIGQISDSAIDIKFKDNGGSNIHWTVAGIELGKTYCPEQWVKYTFPVTIGTAPHCTGPTECESIPQEWCSPELTGCTWVSGGDGLPWNAQSNLNVTFVSTAPHWYLYDTYGQVAISEIESHWSHNVDVCN